MGKLTFFFDRTFGTRLPGALATMKPPMIIRWHQAMGFAHDMPDDEWMEPVGAAQWVVLSQDRKWHEIEVEAQAVRQHGLRCFYLPCIDRWLTLASFMQRHKKMMELAESTPAPFIYRLKKNGQFYPVKIP